MNRTFCSLGLLLALFLTGCGATYEDGRAAYKSKEYEKAATIFRELADQGVATAQFRLARMYIKGRGVAENKVEAEKLFVMAAENGYAKAQVLRGFVFADGRQEVEKDSKKAVEWYRKAAEQGDADGQYWLGSAYFTGEGIPKDETTASNLFLKAAEQGLPEAQASLGACYLYGKGVSQDTDSGEKWLRKAAEQGHLKAQRALAELYGQVDAKQNPKEENKWLQMAAEQGDAASLFKLGVAHAFGIGTPKDCVQGYMWCSLASEFKNPKAEGLRDTIARTMTSEQLEQAKSLVQKKAAEIVANLEAKNRKMGEMIDAEFE